MQRQAREVEGVREPQQGHGIHMPKRTSVPSEKTPLPSRIASVSRNAILPPDDLDP
jgi:hypothetical protein